ncbi:MAG TPA: serine hydrolase domain-containing protein, partial [Thermoanaerobaculia bacterium]|nr:serine hydrolase domain-containing protein [Thermoanaerobaculia bacterium]
MKPGAAIAVIENGGVTTSAHGFADGSTPITPSTNFRLASLTKSFTAAAAMLLVERGVLRYDEPDARGITIRDLVHHTSGLPDYETLLPCHPEPPERSGGRSKDPLPVADARSVGRGSLDCARDDTCHP